MICGLLGRTLGHSYSPQIHAHFGKYEYRLFEKEPDEISSFLNSDAYSGLNVTIPYKKAVIEYCDSLTPIAKRLGAVNTIVKKTDGSLLGHNSDYTGFRSMVEKSGLKLSSKKVLVLGSGGASATVTAVLEDLGAKPIIISRSGKNNYKNLHLHADASAIVNATPVGMYPNTQESPIELSLFPELEGVLDLIYNPARTALLQAAEERNLITENGLWMLIAQAKESAELFIDERIKDGMITSIYNDLSCKMENIILIGMPGSGKTTVGKELANMLGRPFFDADDELVKTAGITIPDIFENHGEEYFRSLETEVLSSLCKRSGLVIATGGGCVTKKRNYSLLHQNGKIIWLQRELSQLPTEGRPLSRKNKLEDMFAVRQPLYRNFADYTVENSMCAEFVTEQIIRVIKEDQEI